jgi:hypothetical protein
MGQGAIHSERQGHLVPTQLMNKTRLQDMYDELSHRPINVAAYDGEFGDVAFDICTADTFVAGIAATLLEGRRPDASHRCVCERENLTGPYWALDDGRRVDLRPVPELYTHARLVEALRRECLRRLST